ncbi:hypothetical protein PG991_000564 [Apiospora marii]|uniref:Uncharacterized protein n=1 Tax=Apiospora marii TaxID=335849 RepID=A0ABR1SUM9_9PEZI
MRFSLANSVALALLGAESLLLSISAAPIGSSKNANSEPKKTYPPKAIPDPFQGHGYELRNSDKTAAEYDQDYGKMYGVWTDRYEGGQEPVYRIGIREDDNSINTLDAFNKDQKWPDGTKHKDTTIELSDMQMHLFVAKGGKRPQDLSVMRYDNVIESSTDAAMYSAIEKLPHSPGNADTEVTVSSKAAPDSEERKIFQEMRKTPLGMNVDKTLQQYSVGKQIQSFKITEQSSSAHLEVHLG